MMLGTVLRFTWLCAGITAETGFLLLHLAWTDARFAPAIEGIGLIAAAVIYLAFMERSLRGAAGKSFDRKASIMGANF